MSWSTVVYWRRYLALVFQLTLKYPRKIIVSEAFWRIYKINVTTPAYNTNEVLLKFEIERNKEFPLCLWLFTLIHINRLLRNDNASTSTNAIFPGNLPLN
jgi:hypothetical protein